MRIAGYFPQSVGSPDNTVSSRSTQWTNCPDRWKAYNWSRYVVSVSARSNSWPPRADGSDNKDEHRQVGCCSGARLPASSYLNPNSFRSLSANFVKTWSQKSDTAGKFREQRCSCPGGRKLWFVYENTQARKSEECKTNPRRPIGTHRWRLECGSTNDIRLHASPLWLSVLHVVSRLSAPACRVRIKILQICCWWIIRRHNWTNI